MRSPDLKLFFAGQGVSLVGTWMQQLAMSWLVYRLTGSTLALGAIAFGGQIPSVVMAPLAGALADRWNRHRLVVAAQTLAMLQATVVAVLVVTGVVQVWHLIVLAVFLGIVNAIDVPARQSLLVRLVASSEDLPNAIALNSSMFNAARLVGPALGGLLVSWLGEGPVFVLNALSYLAVLAALSRIPRGADPPRPSGSVLRTLREGIAYSWGFPPIRGLLLLLTLVATVGLPYTVLLPAFASEVLGGGARTLGLLTASAGLGALIGALYLASRDTVLGLGRLAAASTAVFGGALILLSLSRAVWLSCAILVLSGCSVLVTTASVNTVLQTVVDEEKRGRVMSLYTTAFVGASAIGSMTGGWLASRIGPHVTVEIGGAACLVTAFWFARQIPDLRAMIRPVYARLGILPELATGVNRASELRPRT